MSVVGELLAQVTQQGVDVWHAGPLATFVEEEVVRWLCDLVGYDETSFGLLTSGGVMANFLAMALVRDVHLAAARGSERAAAGGGARGRAGVHVRPDALLDRAGARRAGLPARDARRPADRRPIPPAPGARRRGDRPRPGGRPDADRDLGRRGLHEHGLRRPDRGARGRRASARACGSTSTRRTGRRPGSRPATRGAFPVSSWPTRSPSIPTSGSSRPTTSAASWSATARCSSERSARSSPSTTAAANRRRPRRSTTTTTATTSRASSTSTSSGSRARGAGGR